MCWFGSAESRQITLVSVAGCLGYDVLAYVARYVVKKIKFQLLVV